MIWRSQVRSQLKLTQMQTKKTRRMAAKTRSLQTRNQFTNAATWPHLDLEMVQSATIGTSLLMVIRTSIQRTISPFTAFRGQAESFHTNITLVNGSTLQGDEWPSVPWYPDTQETGAALRDLSWFIKICQGLFPRVHATQDFLYPR